MIPEIAMWAGVGHSVLKGAHFETFSDFETKVTSVQIIFYVQYQAIGLVCTGQLVLALISDSLPGSLPGRSLARKLEGTLALTEIHVATNSLHTSSLDPLCACR